MTISRSTRILAVLGAIALVPAALTACSGSQSVEDACKTAQSTVTEAMGDTTSAMTDPAAALDAFDEAIEAMKSAGDDITNDEVKSAFGDFNDSFAEFGDLMKDASDDPTKVDTEALTDVSTKLQEAGQKIAELCGA